MKKCLFNEINKMLFCRCGFTRDHKVIKRARVIGFLAHVSSLAFIPFLFYCLLSSGHYGLLLISISVSESLVANVYPTTDAISFIQ